MEPCVLLGEHPAWLGLSSKWICNQPQLPKVAIQHFLECVLVWQVRPIWFSALAKL